jgi:citrate lyase synthetase
MVVNAFSTNLTLLAELLNELYERLKELDVVYTKDKRPLYQQSSEFSAIRDMLNG